MKVKVTMELWLPDNEEMKDEEIIGGLRWFLREAIEHPNILNSHIASIEIEERKSWKLPKEEE